ncbi:MAG: Na+/H+ antiporter NhaC family protein [Clostridia bacterium]|nr:Na+/H+ antiporter NhaC family protein [Clostridia bacterium]
MEKATYIEAFQCEECGGTGELENSSRYFGTFMSLAAPIIAIALALITKEVYSSLFIGIVIGALLNAGYNIPKTLDTVINDGLIASVSGTAGIFIFLVILGAMVVLVNKAGGSKAFGRWAQKNIKSKVGATIATFVLGVLIFIDDYFNCLTVGSVMRPVTDSHGISRGKLSYIIDATAAPVCMIAPISSWAAAVSSYAPEGTSGLKMFVTAIPFNFYSILTLIFVVAIAIMGFDYGKMAGVEFKAQTTGNLGAIEAEDEHDGASENGRVLDLVLPIIVLIVACVIALIYNGGFFDSSSEYHLDFIGSFGNTDATVGLPWGSLIALLFTIVYLMFRKAITFKEAMGSIPKGFIAMVPAILILTFATSLKNMTGLLGSDVFVDNLLSGAEGLKAFLPAIIFIVACVIAFSTGTSWGTFGILIPIVLAIFPAGTILGTVGMSACLAGAVCGDHCSPISDTTIMASAGAQCNHVEHVETQLPYAITVAGVSFISFILAGVFTLISDWVAYLAIPVAIALLIGTLFVMKYLSKKKTKQL